MTIGAIGAIGLLSGCEGARTPSDTIGAIGRAIGAIGAHYHMLGDHAKVTMGEVEHNHTQIYVYGCHKRVSESLWPAQIVDVQSSSTPRRRRRSDCVDGDKGA